MMSVAIHAIVLAAGSSRRFGSDKRCYPIQGEPMLQRTIRSVLPVVCHTWVVLGAEDEGILPQLLGDLVNHPGISVTLLADPGHGMGCNLSRATRQLPDNCAAALVVLGDMPFIQTETLCALTASYHPERAVAPVYQGRRGHPVLFPRSWFGLLASLSGDQGARSLLAQAGDRLQLLPTDDEGVLRDVDRPTG